MHIRTYIIAVNMKNYVSNYNYCKNTIYIMIYLKMFGKLIFPKIPTLMKFKVISIAINLNIIAYNLC